MTQALISVALFILPIVVTLAMAYLIFVRQPATNADDQHAELERYDQIIRSVITLSFVSGFLLLSWIGKISPEVFANTAGIILTFWFTSQKTKPNGPVTNGPPKP